MNALQARSRTCIECGVYSRLSLALAAITVAAVAGSPVSAFELTPIGMLSVSTLNNPPGSNAGTAWGYGAMLSQRVHSDVEIETGFIYLVRKVNLGNAPSTSNTYYYEEIPVMVRVQPAGSHFSFGVGAYYAWAIGNFQSETPGAGTTYISYEDDQLSRQDYGVIGAIGFRWPISPRVQFYTDVRYALGLKNIELTSDAQSLKWRDYFQAVGGISFALN